MVTTRRPTLPTLLLVSLLVTAATPLVASAAATCHPRKGCPADSAPADDPVTSPVTIAAPGDGTVVEGTIEARGAVASGYDRVTVHLAGMASNAVTASGAWSVSVPAPTTAGTYTFTVEARGPKGRRAASSVEVQVLAAQPVPGPEEPTEPVPAEPSDPASESEPADPDVLFVDGFDGPDGLLTNEFAYWNPSSTLAVRSPDWEMASGSVFRAGGTAWTGDPDDVGPDATSSNGTNSAVFRLVTTRADLGDVAVAFDLATQRYVATPTTPAVDWDGVHVFLRYQGPQELYYVSVDRRDDRIVVKKKVPGGSSNGGTYHTLATATLRNGHGTWRDLEARVVTNGDGSVTLSLSTAGMTVLRTTDTGTGGPPITEPGRVGIRGDNTEFRLRDWTVTRVHG